MRCQRCGQVVKEPLVKVEDGRRELAVCRLCHSQLAWERADRIAIPAREGPAARLWDWLRHRFRR